MLMLISPDVVCWGAYSDGGRKIRADNALAELRRNADYKKSAIDCVGVETVKRALDMLQAKRVGQEFNDRDTLILNWVECVLRELITPVEVVMELPTDRGELQPAVVFRGIQNYVQDVKLRGEPYERPVEDRSAEEKDEYIDTWGSPTYKYELLWGITAMLNIGICLTFAMCFFLGGMTFGVMCGGVLFLAVSIALILWPQDTTGRTEPRYRFVEKIKWGQALFFKGAPDAELEFGDSWQNWANKSVQGGSKMVAFNNIWEIGGMFRIPLPPGQDVVIPGYHNIRYWDVLTLSIKEDSSDILSVVGISLENGERMTFRRVWEELEGMSKIHVPVFENDNIIFG
jgi:hypothetical protein